MLWEEHMKKRLGWIMVVAALPVLAFLVLFVREERATEAAPGMSKVAVPLDGPLYKDGELLVQMREGVSQSASARVHSSFGATKIKDLGRGAELVKLPEGMSVTEGLALYSANPYIEDASPNYFRYAKQTFPNDEFFSFLWGMNNTGQTGGTIDADIDAPEAWELTTGNPNNIIAVVDTGVDYSHQDLAPNMWMNFDELEASLLTRVTNARDDDDDGVSDDFDGAPPTVPGQPPTMVFDGEDDDTDGVIDDVDGLSWNISGLLALLTNNIDDDGDGIVDDFDGTPTVVDEPPVLVFDGVDSATDSDAIVDDFDGRQLPASYLALVTNGFDEDGGGRADDFDGTFPGGGRNGLPRMDFDGNDNDGDGIIDDFDGIPLEGFDSDNNGYADDVFGINAIIDNPLNDPAAGNPKDDFGHGTHVAGTIGATGNNFVGVPGVNWDVQVMALKFLSSSGSGTVADEIECLNYIARRVAENGEKVVAVNASFGGLIPVFTFEQSAIDNLRQHGVLFVAAAGNIAIDNDEIFNTPSSYDSPNLIAVAATDHNDQLASFSSFGRRTVHVGAPGVNIFSTLMGGDYGPFDVGFSGTSMGTPHVAGLVGLLYARFPFLNPVTDWMLVRNRILAGGDLDQFLAGRTMTGRRLNAFGAVTCSNSTVLARVRPLTSDYKAWLGPSGLELFYTIIPRRNDVTVIFGEDAFGNLFRVPLKLSALHINCENPNGNVTVTIGGQNITLFDNGPLFTPFDVVAGDGVYSGQWDFPFAETDVVATFPNSGTSINPFNDSFAVHVRKTVDPNGFVAADAGLDQTVQSGALVSLDGRISSGRLDVFTPLFYQWTQIGGANSVTLADADTPFPSFTAPTIAAGESQDVLTFLLGVSDLDANIDADSVTIIVLPEPAADVGGGGGGGGSCFIATAAYGSESARDVMVLRQFRDRYLITNTPGSAFVRFYYKFSPPIAYLIADRPALRKAVRMGLAPVVSFAQVMLATTTTEKVVMSLLSAAFTGLLALFGIRRRRTLQSNKLL